MIRARLVDRIVQGWDPVHGASGDARSGAYAMACEASSVENMTPALAAYGLPPLAEWEAIEDDPGLYMWTAIEDDNGCEDERGRWIVDYLIRVETFEPQPWIKDPR